MNLKVIIKEDKEDGSYNVSCPTHIFNRDHKVMNGLNFEKILKKKKSHKESDEMLAMFMTSKAYKDCVSSDDDIYDDLFKDEID